MSCWGWRGGAKHLFLCQKQTHILREKPSNAFYKTSCLTTLQPTPWHSDVLSWSQQHPCDVYNSLHNSKVTDLALKSPHWWVQTLAMTYRFFWLNSDIKLHVWKDNVLDFHGDSNPSSLMCCCTHSFGREEFCVYRMCLFWHALAGLVQRLGN